MHRMGFAAAAALVLAVAAPAFAQPQQQGPTPSPEMMQRMQQMRAANTVDPSQLPRLYSVRVVTTDMARAEHFYHDVFGGRVSQIFPGEDSVQLASGVNLVINRAREPAPAASAAGFIIQVADIDATVQRVTAAGGTVVRAPSPTPSAFGTRAGQIRDPDGVGIEIIQFTAPSH